MQPGCARSDGGFRYVPAADERPAALEESPAGVLPPPPPPVILCLNCSTLPTYAAACFSSMPRTGASAASMAAASRLEAALPGAARAFRSSASQLADITVEVPSMGESITEGTVAVILKQPGVHRCTWGRHPFEGCTQRRRLPQHAA